MKKWIIIIILVVIAMVSLVQEPTKKEKGLCTEMVGCSDDNRSVTLCNPESGKMFNYLACDENEICVVDQGKSPKCVTQGVTLQKGFEVPPQIIFILLIILSLFFINKKFKGGIIK